MTEQLGAKSAREMLSRLFPIVVLSRSGSSLVLSQGQSAVREGGAYRLVVLGEALVDPQTGDSLGYVEQDGGTVSVNRVSERVAYGVATNPTAIPSVIKPGQVRVREEIAVGGASLRGGQPRGASTAGSSAGGRMPARADDSSDVDVDFEFRDTPKKKTPK